MHPSIPTWSVPITSSPISCAMPATAPIPATATSAKCAASATGCAPPATRRTTPFRGLRNVGLPQKIVPPFTPAEIHALLRRCNSGTPLGSRDQALLLTLLDTGVRCAEAVALDLADCDFATRRLHVRHGKGDKARVVPFADHCADALATYVLDRGTDAGPLFLGARYGRLHPGVRLGVNGLKIRLRTLGREAGVPKVHAHRFRHTFATWAIAVGPQNADRA